MADAPPETALTARELGLRSRAAVHDRDRDAWLDLFAHDALVQDPVGPSPFDPEGKGHHGREAIAAFYDAVIAPSVAINFDLYESYLCGNEVADVGVIRTVLAGGTHCAIVHVVMTYRTDGHGKIASLRAYWEFDALEIVELEG